MKLIRAIPFIAALLAPCGVWASGATVHLDRAPVNVDDKLSLQRGARVFVNYCLNCHSASYMRYSRLGDLGLSEPQIVQNLMFTGEKPVDTMTVALRRQDGEAWFGVAPPDLTVIARSRGADWLYTYLRGFYRDPSRPTGWNNTVFANVGMPHVMWDLQGEQVLEHDAHGAPKLTLTKAGRLSQMEYDALVADLVNYLVWMGEPAQTTRRLTGVGVLVFLLVLLPLAYYLKKEFWKDVH